MAKWVFSCWQCRQPTDMEDKVMRDDECPHCRVDMRSCKNCEYYDPGAHNDLGGSECPTGHCRCLT